MKKQVMKIVAAIGFLFALSAVSAFAQVRPMKADIPFDFQVNGKTLPAGEYRVTTPDSPKGTILVRNDHGKAAVSLTQGATAKNAPKTAQLVFRRYGNQYFLAQIFDQGDTAGCELPQSKAERNLIKEMGARHLAKNQVVPEIVTIVAGQ